MTEEINKYIDLKISNSLLSKTPDKFTDKLMREIELSKEFERQDKKVNISVRYIISGFIVLILSFAFTISYYFTSQLDKENSVIESEYGNIGNYINGFFSNLFSLFGITFTKEFFLYAIAIMILFGIITIADKRIFKRGY
ncbi:MAG: hypothetical protein NTU73_01405 [Ignavibacteriae bacterium]|nr:hypothetical protein [Ignavibacteriota bacterium]